MSAGDSGSSYGYTQGRVLPSFSGSGHRVPRLLLAALVAMAACTLEAGLGLPSLGSWSPPPVRLWARDSCCHADIVRLFPCVATLNELQRVALVQGDGQTESLRSVPVNLSVPNFLVTAANLKDIGVVLMSFFACKWNEAPLIVYLPLTGAVKRTYASASCSGSIITYPGGRTKLPLSSVSVWPVLLIPMVNLSGLSWSFVQHSNPFTPL